MASSEFTFVHPSSNPVTSIGYNIDFHASQNVFSPINYSLPAAIQFPTPPATSVPFGGSSFGSCVTEAATSSASYNHVPWPIACVAPSQTSLHSFSSWPVVSALSECALLDLEPHSTSTLEILNISPDKFTCGIQSQVRCKRKAVDIPEDGWIPSKIHVNEERMSACMNDLRLDNNNIGAQPDFENEMWYSRDVMTDASETKSIKPECLDVGRVPVSRSAEESRRLGLNGNSRLELCSALQLGMKTKEILPKVVLDEVVKSYMQVVLWKPPELFGQHMLNNLSGVESKLTRKDENSNTEEDTMSNSNSYTFEANLTTNGLTFSDEWFPKPSLSVAATTTTTVMDECEEMDL